MGFENITIPLAVLAGLLSFISPCVLPLVPVYLGYLTGVAVSGQETAPRRDVMGHALMFIAGFTLIFVILGVAAGLAFGVFLRTSFADGLIKVGGVLLIILGLHMSGVLKWVAAKLDDSSAIKKPIAWLDYRLDMLILPERRMQTGQGKSPGMIRSGFVGMTFAAGWTPCIGPLLGAILTLAASASFQADTATAILQSVILLLAYSMGLAIPFLLTALLLTGATGFLRRLNRHAH
ncbi:MAG: cytochrome c biogenesis CcdA family protein, partial [Anaerolineae bacterium]